mmetsp:Transcript_38832/g.97270  ORF Transcript_38832/g.97270 Transcript_38832/m.97270 type:complete len:202 (+) Transcript_38832:791-1396(+)
MTLATTQARPMARGPWTSPGGPFTSQRRTQFASLPPLGQECTACTARLPSPRVPRGVPSTAPPLARAGAAPLTPRTSAIRQVASSRARQSLLTNLRAGRQLLTSHMVAAGRTREGPSSGAGFPPQVPALDRTNVSAPVTGESRRRLLHMSGSCYSLRPSCTFLQARTTMTGHTSVRRTGEQWREQPLLLCELTHTQYMQVM